MNQSEKVTKIKQQSLLALWSCVFVPVLTLLIIFALCLSETPTSFAAFGDSAAAISAWSRFGRLSLRSIPEILWNLHNPVRIDLFTFAALELVPASYQHIAVVATLGAILSVLILIWRTQGRVDRQLGVWESLTAVLVAVTLVKVTGCSISILTALLAIALASLSLLSYLRNPRPIALIIYSLSVLFLALTNFPSVGLLVTVVALIVIQTGRIELDEGVGFFRVRQVVFFVSALLILAVGVVFPPEIWLPTYPPFAELVPPTLLSGVDPLVGPAPSLPIINRQLVRGGLSWISLVIFGVTLSLYIIVRLKDSIQKNNEDGSAYKHSVLHIALFLSISLLLASSIFPESINLIGPLYSIERLWPYGVWQPYELIALPLAAFFLFQLLAGRAVFVIAPLLLIINESSYLSSGPEKAVIKDLNSVTLSDNGREMIQHNLGSPSGALLLSALSNRAMDTYSASGSLEDRVQLLVNKISESQKLTELQFQRLNLDEVKLFASHRSDLLSKIVDDDPETRWSAMRGGQLGDEWLLLHFSPPRIISAVSISIGIFVGDQPAELTVRSWSSCPTPGETSAADWEGQASLEQLLLKATRNGLLYRSRENKVEVLVDDTFPVECLTISQTWQNADVDWSIANLRVASPRETKQ